MYLFRWYYDTFTDVIYTELTPVKSEEGILIQPIKTCDDFCKEDYDCLILPGCSDIRNPIRNNIIKEFLKKFTDDNSFIIGAICSGPLFLPQAVVEDGNIITDEGNAFNDFAVHIARKLGYDCPDKILSGYIDSDDTNDYIHHLTEEDLLEFKNEFQDLL